MPLDASKLASGLTSAWAAFPPDTTVAATSWANAYQTYAVDAVACNALPLAPLGLQDLIDGLKDAIDTVNGTYSDIAQKVADAHQAFWDGSNFGGTSTVVATAGTAALKSALEALWAAQSLVPIGVPFPASGTAHAALFDTFTKAVTVGDSAVPPPSGCPPAPLS